MRGLTQTSVASKPASMNSRAMRPARFRQVVRSLLGLAG
jgi:hypothetical protein